jgi:hypothetical protein
MIVVMFIGSVSESKGQQREGQGEKQTTHRGGLRRRM